MIKTLFNNNYFFSKISTGIEAKKKNNTFDLSKELIQINNGKHGSKLSTIYFI